MRTVNIDLDGVVYPWHEVMAVYAFQKAGHQPTAQDFKYEWDFGNELPYPAPTSWGFMPEWGLTPKQFDSLFRLGVDEGVVWTQGVPLAGSVEGLWTLDDAGFYIRIVTHRLVHKNNHSVAQQATSAWLDRWNIPYHEIVYIGSGAAKGDIAADFALDDKPLNIMNWNQRETAKAFLLDRPWNRDFDTDSRLYDWQSFVDIVTGMYEDTDDGPSAWPLDQDEELQTESSDSS